MRRAKHSAPYLLPARRVNWGNREGRRLLSETAAAWNTIGTHYLKIAAICLAHDATLLTRNLKDFGQVPSLLVEDWSAQQG